MATTVIELFDDAARRWAAEPALRARRDGAWRATTWGEYRAEVRAAARGLLALGAQPGQGLAIMGFNRPKWFYANLAAIHAGTMPAGIYTTCSPEQIQYIVDHCDATVAVLENADYLARLEKVRHLLPKLKAIVLMDGPGAGEGVLGWREMIEKGKSVPESALDERIAAQKPRDCCTLVYTSGTTGPPKAVMLCHENITHFAAAVTRDLGDLFPVGGGFLSYLPLSHIAEQVVSLYAPMTFGGCSWFAESIEKLGDNLREVRPVGFLGVPRVWEKIQAKIVAAAAGNSGLKRKIGAWARSVGLAAGYAAQEGRGKPLLHGLADRLVFSKVRERLGLDRCRIEGSSTAPIARETLEFFLSLGIPISEIYGMSECTGPATLSRPDRYRTGKAGWALWGTELRIAEDGEVLIRGPHVFLGYYKDEAATKEALDADGWLHSGDVGTIDAEGYLSITDRKKEIIITAGGKNISPQLLEAKLKAIPVVGQAVVIGDRRRFLSALLTLDAERLPVEARKAGLSVDTPRAAIDSPEFGAYLRSQVDAVNATVSRVEAVRKYVVLPHELTIDGGELTHTMKLKRRVIHEKYAGEIEGMYA